METLAGVSWFEAGVRRGAFVALVALVPVVGCGAEPKVVTGCDPADGIVPICGFENPEDLAPLPGGSWIAVSQYAGAEDSSGSLVAFRIADGRKLDLYPDPNAGPDPDPGWGASECPGPPDPDRFAPHGIDVDLGSHTLVVVNHGDREAVEFFEIGHSPRGPALVWRGCAPIPDDVWANDVALLPDGGLVLTRMLGAQGLDRALSMLRMLLGFTTGYVLEWQPDAGWSEVPGSHGNGPNGIVVSPDGRVIFFAEWTGPRLVRLRRGEDGEMLDRDHVELNHHPDNLTWTRDGQLLVTGQIGPIGELLGCGDLEEGTCAVPFSVLLVDPGTLDVQTVIEHPATAHGAASVALEIGDEILIGTFAGDRLGRAAFER
jgi:hypothetical protein